MKRTLLVTMILCTALSSSAFAEAFDHSMSVNKRRG